MVVSAVESSSAAEAIVRLERLNVDRESLPASESAARTCEIAICKQAIAAAETVKCLVIVIRSPPSKFPIQAGAVKS